MPGETGMDACTYEGHMVFNECVNQAYFVYGEEVKKINARRAAVWEALEKTRVAEEDECRKRHGIDIVNLLTCMENAKTNYTDGIYLADKEYRYDLWLAQLKLAQKIPWMGTVDGDHPWGTAGNDGPNHNGREFGPDPSFQNRVWIYSCACCHAAEKARDNCRKGNPPPLPQQTPDTIPNIKTRPGWRGRGFSEPTPITE